ncbi:hypothetical protein [Streptomyces graminilatus]|uniref:hypothetical protein n=1 Tax=Streptomyces graminilatus TaxID=1464070 RepID=UPI000B1B2018|nr:hypothetical protein [Streptomyces graminilatus]
MQRIEFVHFPVSDDPSAPLRWGMRVGGTDLRVLVAKATRHLWRKEHQKWTEAKQERFLLTQHIGLYVEEVGDPLRHFLGDPSPRFTDSCAGATPLLGCVCGDWACWPLLALVTATSETVTWSSFRQPHREQWGELDMGPYVFDRTAYEAALAHPVRLDEDPIGPDPDEMP